MKKMKTVSGIFRDTNLWYIYVFIEEQSSAVLTIVETSFSLPKNTFTNTNNVIFVLGSK